jgi:tripartite-type tricarboxylate transporter receptor subunit TctC
MIWRRVLVAVAFLCAALVAKPGFAADDYPNRAITIVVPFAPGGGADILARLIAQKLNEAWGRAVVIENKPGASGITGSTAVGRSDPDGYTLLMAASGAITAANAKDLAPVTLAAAPPYLLVVHPSLPVTSVRELIAYLKAHPGEVNYASSGVGAASHLSSELFMAMSGTKMIHVPYRGVGQAVNDLIAGTVTVMFGPPPAVLPHVEAGKLKVLAVSSSMRSPLFPEFPTVSEAGIPGYEAVGWFGLFAPAKTPKELMAKIAGETGRALKGPEMQQRLASMGAVPAPNTPDEFAAFIEADTAKWAKLMASAGIAQ